MTRDLNTVAVRHLPPGYARMSAPVEQRHTMRQWIARAERRGEIRTVGPLYATGDGRVEVTYKRLKPAPRPTPMWVRPALLIGGVSLVALGLGYAAMRAVEAVASAVTDPAGALVGFLMILGTLLLSRAAIGRRERKPRTIRGTFEGVIK